MNEWIIPDWPAPPGVKALTTTRNGGYSINAYAGFNLALHVGDNATCVAANRQRLRNHLPVMPVWISQVHGHCCVPVEMAWSGTEADASFTRGTSQACAVLTADCLPVLLCNDSGTVVAAVHAGWRGLAGGVIESAVVAMGVPGARLLAWLGPAIGPQAFEVGTEVRTAFIEEDPAAKGAFSAGRTGHWQCDLYALARRRLARLGVERVFGGSFCTFTEHERFYSYRRDGVTGRMATLIWREPGCTVSRNPAP